MRLTASRPLLRANISYHAHESPSKFYSLANFDRNQPISELLKTEIIMKRIGSQRSLENREIEIRFLFDSKDVVRPHWHSFDFPLPNSVKYFFWAVSSFVP